MADDTSTNGSLALDDKQYRLITIEATEQPQDIKLRVAAYARVSTSSDDQMNSFAAQNTHYASVISENENWKMVDLYADAGITGTSAEKREDFQRLLADCRRGLIDRVLVKSISRFARNAKECLQIIRELKAIGVSVYFEEQRIDTGKMSGELLTAIFAAIAQKESESISANMRWSYRQRMESGTYLPSHQPYGYYLKDGQITIDESKAAIVREIFSSYLDGQNTIEIAEKLERIQAEHPKLQNYKWDSKAVVRILKNEKYIGDSLWQKSYSSDTLPVKTLPNRGERKQYYAENTHPAIIDAVTYHLAQARLRQHNTSADPSKKARYILKDDIMRCGGCGAYLRHKNVRGKHYCVCKTHDYDAKVCSLLPIAETEIEKAFLRLYYKLKHHGEPILSGLLQNLLAIRERRMLWSLDIIDLNKKIAYLTSQNQTLAELKQQGLVDPDIFISQSNGLAEQLRTAKLQKEKLLNAERDDTIPRTQELMETLDAVPDHLDAFDAELFGELVDKIIVESNERLRFLLKNGLELTERIERTVR